MLSTFHPVPASADGLSEGTRGPSASAIDAADAHIATAHAIAPFSLLVTCIPHLIGYRASRRSPVHHVPKPTRCTQPQTRIHPRGKIQVPSHTNEKQILPPRIVIR